MFGMLRGRVVFHEEDNIILDVNGVGYLVFMASNLIPSLGTEDVLLYVQTIVKEDSISLYGFKDLEHKKLFNLLITVQGVGAKIALVILSRISLSDLQRVVMFEDINTLKTVPGIGIKVAQRIVNELKDKITKISVLNLGSTSDEGVSVNKNQEIDDAILALNGLGYSSFEINKAIAKLNDKLIKTASSEDIIKEVLQFFAKGM